MENKDEKDDLYDFIHKDSIVNVPVTPSFVTVLYEMINYFALKMGKEELLLFAKRHIDGKEPPQTEYESYISTLSAFIVAFEISAKQQNLTHTISEKEVSGMTYEEKEDYFRKILEQTKNNKTNES